ncbi:MAG: FIST N-terminal domain-containing protein, partial [Bacteroidota bacterium]
GRSPAGSVTSPQLVLVFGNRKLLEEKERFEEIKSFYPKAQIVSVSTSGEIIGRKVQDETIVINAIEFEKTEVKLIKLNRSDFESSRDLGGQMSSKLNTEDLRHILVFSDGGLVNGSELVKGLNNGLPENVAVTGGLAGDDARFEKTLIGLNEAPSSGNVVGIGLYGADLKIGYGSAGGWEAFGPKRRITKSKGNVLMELDNKSALELYKLYLGDMAKELPGAALRFPLSVELAEGDKPLVRTILTIDEESQTMTFAGDLPEGSTVRFMKANFDKLIDAAGDAANSGRLNIRNSNPELAILISCVGRKLVLDQMVEEEVESTSEIIGSAVNQIGFYSYGEISPWADSVNCELHNQTMTITIFSEH